MRRRRENNGNVVAVVYSFIIKIRPSHFYCFPVSSSTTTTLLLFSIFLHQHHCHHQSSSVFPPSPPHFYCFPYPTTTITTFPMHILLLMFSAFTYSILAGKAFGFVSKYCVKQNTTHSSYPTQFCRVRTLLQKREDFLRYVSPYCLLFATQCRDLYAQTSVQMDGITSMDTAI